MKQVLRFSMVLFTGLIAACGDSRTAPRDPSPAPSYSVSPGAGRFAFGFNGTVVSAAGDSISLTGGGSYDPTTGSNVIPSATTSGHGNGGFRCITNVTTSQLAGCAAGEGVRWDTSQLLTSSPFKCGGVANESLKTATTADGVVVLNAEFYRAGDGNDESFTAKIFIADHDLAPDVPGMQNLWIQGFGCGTGTVNFNR